MKSNSRLFTTLIPRLVVGSLGLVACGNGDTNNMLFDAGVIDAAVDVADSAGQVLPLENYDVSGMVVDYFSGDDSPVLNATVVTEGVNPAISATIDAQGAYLMEVLANSLFYLTSSAPDYVLSRSGALQMLASPIVRTQVVASEVGIARQYTSVGVTQQANTGIVMVDLRNASAQPIVGLSTSDVILSTTADPGVPVGSAFFVASDGNDLSPNATTPLSVLDNYAPPDVPVEIDVRRARAGFLNVAPGEYNVSVTLPDLAGTQTIFVIVPQEGASFVVSNINGDGRGDPTLVLDPTSALGFVEDIYPILQTVARGGDGCATCHVSDFVLPLVGTAEETFALLQMDAVSPAGTPLINLSEPEASPFLQNPVYEDVPNHPNVFWTINSNHYQGIIAWITQGAALLREDAVLP